MNTFRMRRWQLMMVAVFVGIVATLEAASAADQGGAGQPNDKRPIYLDRSAHAAAENSCSPGNLWQGDGNPNTTFQRKRNLDAGVELAIKALRRQGPDIRSSYVDRVGVVHIEVPTGAQPGNPGRAAWNFTYSYNVALDPNNPTLEDFDGELWIDLDPSPKTKYLKLTLAPGGPVQSLPCVRLNLNGYLWKSGTTPIISDEEGTQQVTQNSRNYAFYRQAIDTDPQTPGIQPYAFGPAQFDVVMALKQKGHGDDDDDDDDADEDDDKQGEWTILHAVFHVVNAPTQTP